MTVQPTPPIIVWTFRRTGGTSLKSILFHLTGRPSFEDEALNDDPPRELGGVTAAFRQTGDVGPLMESLSEHLKSRRNLKHCCETVPFEVTRRLFEASLEFDYRHVLLLRIGEIDRLISLEIARKLNAWGPDEARQAIAKLKSGEIEAPELNVELLRKRAKADAEILGMILRLFMAARRDYVLVFFEDLYHGATQTRCREFRRIASAVGIDGAEDMTDDVFENAATQSGQDTRGIAEYITNLSEARAALEEIVYEPTPQFGER
jgi:hypothetical protein